MPFCKLNGITVPVEAGEQDDEFALIEDRERTEGSSLLIDRRAEKFKKGFTIACQTAAYASAFRRLLHGEGHYWGFDATPPGVYSSKGLGPQAQNGGALATDQSWLGGGSLKFLFSDSGRNITYEALAPNSVDGWTVMVAARETGGAVWAHWLATSTLGMAGATWWKDGVFGFGITPYSASINTGTGRVTLQGDTNTTWFDELVILPYAVPSDWPAQIYAAQAAGLAWGANRNLRLTGDILPDPVTSGTASKTVVGEVGSVKARRGKLSGSTVVRTLKVELEEV
ncbi:MAG: hypothetical protein AAB721_02795 [Patescibacteria group bacterium]